MIRMSRISVVARFGAVVTVLVLGAGGCAQSGIGNGGLGGGAGTGGTGTGGTIGSAGAGGDTGVMTACPVDPPVSGARCSGDLHCSYGSQTCCGMSYASEVATCSNGKFSVGFVETGCQIGGSTCAGTGGAAGAGGAGGGGGSNCPATPTPEGFSCLPGDPGLGCTYGSTSCCGIIYPTLRLTCQQDSIVHQVVENPCTADGGYLCPPVSDGGAGGGGGAAGGGCCAR